MNPQKGNIPRCKAHSPHLGLVPIRPADRPTDRVQRKYADVNAVAGWAAFERSAEKFLAAPSRRSLGPRSGFTQSTVIFATARLQECGGMHISVWNLLPDLLLQQVADLLAL